MDWDFPYICLFCLFYLQCHNRHLFFSNTLPSLLNRLNLYFSPSMIWMYSPSLYLYHYPMDNFEAFLSSDQPFILLYINIFAIHTPERNIFCTCKYSMLWFFLPLIFKSMFNSILVTNRRDYNTLPCFIPVLLQTIFIFISCPYCAWTETIQILTALNILLKHFLKLLLRTKSKAFCKSVKATLTPML